MQTEQLLHFFFYFSLTFLHVFLFVSHFIILIYFLFTQYTKFCSRGSRSSLRRAGDAHYTLFLKFNTMYTFTFFFKKKGKKLSRDFIIHYSLVSPFIIHAFYVHSSFAFACRSSLGASRTLMRLRGGRNSLFSHFCDHNTIVLFFFVKKIIDETQRSIGSTHTQTHILSTE